MRLRLIFGFVVVALLGCNTKPYTVGPVSGRVTLDGNPLPKASVTFVPMATKENLAPGPTATAITNADGRYSLTIDRNTPGGVVGKCRIYITTLLTDPAIDERDGGPPIKRPKDKVPDRYNQKTELVFEVPPGGTDQANFELKSQ
jgi:hypothetical protein